MELSVTDDQSSACWTYFSLLLNNQYENSKSKKRKKINKCRNLTVERSWLPQSEQLRSLVPALISPGGRWSVIVVVFVLFFVSVSSFPSQKQPAYTIRISFCISPSHASARLKTKGVSSSKKAMSNLAWFFVNGNGWRRRVSGVSTETPKIAPVDWSPPIASQSGDLGSWASLAGSALVQSQRPRKTPVCFRPALKQTQAAL